MTSGAVGVAVVGVAFGVGVATVGVVCVAAQL